MVKDRTNIFCWKIPAFMARQWKSIKRYFPSNGREGLPDDGWSKWHIMIPNCGWIFITFIYCYPHFFIVTDNPVPSSCSINHDTFSAMTKLFSTIARFTTTALTDNGIAHHDSIFRTTAPLTNLELVDKMECLTVPPGRTTIDDKSNLSMWACSQRWRNEVARIDFPVTIATIQGIIWPIYSILASQRDSLCQRLSNNHWIHKTNTFAWF